MQKKPLSLPFCALTRAGNGKRVPCGPGGGEVVVQRDSQAEQLPWAGGNLQDHSQFSNEKIETRERKAPARILPPPPRAPRVGDSIEESEVKKPRSSSREILQLCIGSDAADQKTQI